MKTYAMMQLGCKVNDFEATYVKEKLNAYYQEVDFKDVADIYLIFTCCVTNMAEAKTRKFLHKARRNNPNAYIVAIGCLSQIKGDSDDFRDCDLIIGSDKKDQIVSLILAHTKDNLVNKEIGTQFENLYIESYPGKSRAFLKIQDGCNQFCSYCIIPYSRGRERSCDHNLVLKQANELSQNFNEIVLTGIHTGRYFDGEFNLYQLLVELLKIESLQTIRLSSIEITEISDEIIELMKHSTKLAHHLHIPIQAASDEVLSLMHRPYTLQEFKDRIQYIREQIPRISISTDLIVGFPKETDSIFEKSLFDLKEIGFSFIHVFPYSRKTGTFADNMEGHIAPTIKKQRVQTIMDLQRPITKTFYNQFLNQNVEILIEKNDDFYSYGYCKEYIYCKVNGIVPVGKIIKAVIVSIHDIVVIANVTE